MCWRSVELRTADSLVWIQNSSRVAEGAALLAAEAAVARHTCAAILDHRSLSAETLILREECSGRDCLPPSPNPPHPQ